VGQVVENDRATAPGLGLQVRRKVLEHMMADVEGRFVRTYNR
jgi:hypothetical protein